MQELKNSPKDACKKQIKKLLTVIAEMSRSFKFGQRRMIVSRNLHEILRQFRTFSISRSKFELRTTISIIFSALAPLQPLRFSSLTQEKSSFSSLSRWKFSSGNLSSEKPVKSSRRQRIGVDIIKLRQLSHTCESLG